MSDADIRFYFDPVCPFAWMTSKWVRMVAARRDYTVDWRFISLRLINSAIDYDSHFPAGYEEGHASGLRLLRVAARTRAVSLSMPSSVNRSLATFSTCSSLAIASTSSALRARLRSSLTVSSSNDSISSISFSGT